MCVRAWVYVCAGGCVYVYTCVCIRVCVCVCACACVCAAFIYLQKEISLEQWFTLFILNRVHCRGGALSYLSFKTPSFPLYVAALSCQDPLLGL